MPGSCAAIDPVGVVATTDPAGLLDGDADVVVYAAAANLRPLEAVNDMVSILRAGKNVVSCSVVPLVYPNAVDRRSPTHCARPRWPAGCRSSPPVSIADSPMMFYRWHFRESARTIDSIRVTEMFNYATYPDGTAVYDILGFGKPPEEVPFAATPGVFTFGWGPVLHQLADGLGVRVDDIKETVERIPAAMSFDTPTGHIVRRNNRRDEVHVDRVRRGQSDLRHRPRHPHARRHRARLAAATHFDPAA